MCGIVTTCFTLSWPLIRTGGNATNNANFPSFFFFSDSLSLVPLLFSSLLFHWCFLRRRHLADNYNELYIHLSIITFSFLSPFAVSSLTSVSHPWIWISNAGSASAFSFIAPFLSVLSFLSSPVSPVSRRSLSSPSTAWTGLAHACHNHNECTQQDITWTLWEEKERAESLRSFSLTLTHTQVFF
jgi:hypothetical protein